MTQITSPNCSVFSTVNFVFQKKKSLLIPEKRKLL